MPLTISLFHLKKTHKSLNAVMCRELTAKPTVDVAKIITEGIFRGALFVVWLKFGIVGHLD